MRNHFNVRHEFFRSHEGADGLPTWHFGAPDVPRARALRPLAIAVSLAIGGLQAGALAQTNLVIDGKTATNVRQGGSTYDVTTGTVKGANAFNSFKRFEVGQPDTVNLRLPDGTNTLINMVYDAPIRIDGVLNSIKGNQIGGRLVFADPFGMVVGRTGVLNVGSLIATSPNSSFLAGVINGAAIDDASVDLLLSTKLQQAAGSSVRIDGRINALERVRLQAENVLISAGSVVRVGPEAAQQAAFKMAVNTQGLEQATGLTVNNGVIEIVGQQIAIGGELNASGRNGGGAIHVGRVEDQLADSVDVATTAVIKADAGDSGNGGFIDVWGTTRNNFLGLLSARGGDQGGDGGFVEVSGKTGLNYAGFADTRAPLGKAGNLLIDPDTICIVVTASTAGCAGGSQVTLATIESNLAGGNFTVQADEKLWVGLSDGSAISGTIAAAANTLTLKGDDIEVTANTRLSTTGAGLTLKQNDDSTGTIVVQAGATLATNGGDINVNGVRIAMGGARLDSTRNNGNSGNITLDTSGLDWSRTMPETISLNGTTIVADKTGATGKAGVITLQGRDITIQGGSTLSSLGESGVEGKQGEVKVYADSLDEINIFGIRSGSASVTIDGSTIKADKTDVHANTEIRNLPIIPALTDFSDPQATIDYWDQYDTPSGALLASGTLGSEAISVLGALTGINVVLSKVTVESTVNITGNSLVNGRDSTNIAATTNGRAGNADSLASYLPGSLAAQSKLGLGAMLISVDATATVNIGANVTLSGKDLSVQAENRASALGSVYTSNTDAAAGSGSSGAVALTAGVGLVDVHSSVTFDSGAKVDNTGDIDIHARNRTTFSNVSTAATGAQGKLGLGLAFTQQDTSAIVNFNANVNDAKSFSLYAIDEMGQNETSANGSAGETAFARLGKNVSNLTTNLAPATVITGIAAKYAARAAAAAAKAGKATPDTGLTANIAPSRYAGALAISLENHQSTVNVGDGVVIHTRADATSDTNNIFIAALTSDRQQALTAAASAVSSTSGDLTQKAAAGAVAFGMVDHGANVNIGKNVTLTGQRVGIFSEVEQPMRRVTDSDYFDANNWNSVSKVVDRLGLLAGTLNLGFVNNKAQAVGAGEESGFAGSVTIMLADNHATTEIGAGTKIQNNGDKTGDWSRQLTLHVDANIPDKNEYFTFSAAAATAVQSGTDVMMLMQSGAGLQLANGGDVTGLSNGFMLVNNDAQTIIREGVVMRGVTETSTTSSGGGLVYAQTAADHKGDVSLRAANNSVLVNMAIGAGKGGEDVVNVMAVENIMFNTAYVRMDDEVKVNADKLTIDAYDTPQLYAIAGAMAALGNTSVGAGIAVNYANTDTLAEIADNDVAGSTLSAGTNLIDVGTLDANAHTGGNVIALGASGSVASGGTKTGKIGQALKKLAATANEAASYVNTLFGNQAPASAAAQSALAKPAQPADWTYSGAGSIGVNITDLSTKVNLDGVGGKAGAISGTGTSDVNIVTVAGAVAATLSSNETKGESNLAGAVAVNVVGNSVVVNANDLSFTGAKNVAFEALKGGESLSLGIGVTAALDTSLNPAQQANNYTGTASITLDLHENADYTGGSKNAARVFVTDSSFTGDGTGDFLASAYNSTKIGTGGGSLSLFGTNATGGTITYAQINNDTQVSVDGLTTASYAHENFNAYSAAQIVAGAASAAGSNKTSSDTTNGAIIINVMGNDTTVSVKDSTLSSSPNLSAREGARVAANETRLQSSDVLGGGYDYSGGTLFTDSSMAGGQDGASILSVAGVIQVATGKDGKNAGASIIYSQVANTTSATADGVTAASGAVAATAQSDAYIRSFAIGASGAKDSSLGGSVAVNVIANDIDATVKDSSVRGANVSAVDNSHIDAFAGQINISTAESGTSGGAALVVNVTANEANAQLKDTTVTGGLAGDGSSIYVNADSNTRIRSLAVGAALATGAKSDAMTGSFSLNGIYNSQTSLADGVTATGMSGTEEIWIGAHDGSTIQTLSGAMAFSKGDAYGAAVASNYIGGTTKATGKSLNLDGIEYVTIVTTGDATIQSLAIGVAGSKDGDAYTGSLAVNTVANTSAALLDSSTVANYSVLSVSGEDTSTIGTASGAAAIAKNGQAIGAALSVNTVTNTNSADVTGSTITSGSNNATVSFTETATIEARAASGAVGDESSGTGSFAANTVTNSTNANVTTSSITAGSIDLLAKDNSTINTFSGAATYAGSGTAVGVAGSANTVANTTGVTVDRSTLAASSSYLKAQALNQEKIFGIGASAAVAGSTSPGVTVVGTINTITNGTSVSVLGSKSSGSAVTFYAKDDATIEAYNGAVSYSSGGTAVGAALANNVVTNSTNVLVDDKVVGPTTYASSVTGTLDLTIEAINNEVIKAVAAGAAASSDGTSGSGAGINNVIVNTTTAKMVDTTAKTRDTFIRATDTGTISNIGGALSVSLSQNAVGAALSVNTVSNTVEASASNSNITLDNNGAGGGIHVKAKSQEQIDSMAASGAGGEETSVAGSATTNTITNDTTASMTGVTVTHGAGGELTAEDASTIRSLAGGAAIGLSGNAVGGAGSINTVTNTTQALMSGNTDLGLGGSAFTQSATNTSTLKTGAVALAGTITDNAVAPVLATNVIVNTTRATADNTKVGAGSIAQLASDTSTIQSWSGAVALSADKTGVGISTSFNNIHNTITAGGTGASLTASGGTLTAGASSAGVIESYAIGLSAAGKLAVTPSFAENTVANDTEITFVNSTLSGTGVAITAGTANAAGTSSGESASIRTLSGALSISGEKAIGAAGSLNTISNTTKATITGGSLAAGTGALAVKATNSQSIGAVGAAGGAGDSTSVGAALTTNTITNTTQALVSGTQGGGTGAEVSASDTANIQSLAGGAALSVSGNSGGGAGSVNTVSNTTKALVEGGASLSAGTGTMTHSATNSDTIKSAAVALAGSFGNIAVGVTNVTNTIANNTQATATNATLKGGVLTQSASDIAKIQTLAGAAALTTGGTGVGVATAFNQITNTVSVGASGGSLTATSGLLSSLAKNVATIDSIAVALSASSDNAVSPSLATNTVVNETDATFAGTNLSGVGITIGASTSNQADQSTLGQGDATIRTLSGAAALGFGGGAAVGGAGSINTVTNGTQALVSGGTLNAGSGALSLTAVNDQSIKAIAASAAGSAGGAAAGSATVDTITNTTRAQISDAADVTATGATIKATDNSAIDTIAGAAVVGLGGAGVGVALSTNTIVNTTDAQVQGSALKLGAGNVTIAAEGNSKIRGLAASVAGSSGITVAGSAIVNTIHNSTTAGLGTTSVTGGKLTLSAKDTSTIQALSGGVAIGGGTAVGIAAANNYIGNTTSATADRASTTLTGAFDVSATAADLIESIGVSAGAGPDGGAGAAVGNTVDNSTTAQITGGGGTTITSVGGSAVASDTSTISSISGAAAIGVGGVAVGGAASINTIHNNTKALIDSAVIKAGAGAFTHTATNGETIKSLAAAGAAAPNVAVGVSAATNTIVNKTWANMTSSSLTAGNVTEQAQDSATIQSLSGAAALALGGPVGVGFAASINTISNEVLSGASSSSFTLTGTLSNDTKSTEHIDTIAVAMSAAGGAAVSPSASTNTIANTTRASYTLSSASSTGTTIAASDGAVIRNLTGAAALDFGGGAAVGGAASINTVTNTVEALIDGNGGTWATGAGSLSVTAKNSEDIQAIAAAAAASANVGVAGSIVTGTITNTTRARVASVAVTGGGLTVGSQDISDIKTIGGAVGIGLGTVGAGLAASSAVIVNTVESIVRGATATLGSGAASVTANADTDIWGLAAAGAGGSGGAGSGSNVNGNIAVTTTALVDSSTINAGSIVLSATDDADTQTLAGSVALSGGVSIGIANAVNTVTNPTTARALKSTLNGGSGGVTLAATGGGTIQTMAVGGAIAAGAISGSNATNVISNSTLAELDGSSVSTTGDVKVNAQDTSAIDSLAGAASAGGSGSVGVAASSNVIANNIDARIRGVASTDASGYHAVSGRDLIVGALSAATIRSLAAGAAVDGVAGVAGSASVNVISTNTRTLIDRSADVTASNNAIITASSNDSITSVAGSAGIGIAAFGAGISSGIALVTGETSATVGGSDVGGKATQLDASGSSGTSDITTGELTVATTPPSTLAIPSTEYILGTLATTTQAVRGVAVTAQAMRHFANGAFSVGGGTVGAAGTFNVNTVVGSTTALIDSAKVNQRTGSPNAAQDINVIAASHTYGAGFAGAVGIGAATGAGAAMESSVYEVTTRAKVVNSVTTAANNATVKARATEGISTMDVGASAGLVGVQGTGNLGIMRGATEAAVYGGTFTAKTLTVKADHDANFGAIVGGVSGGLVGGAGSFGVLVNSHVTTARIGASTVAADNETASTTVNTTGNVLVDADSDTTISQATLSGSLGAEAFSGAVGVTVLDDTALATLNKSTVTASNGNVNVESAVNSTLLQTNGAAAIGFGTNGVGASLGVALLRGQSDAWIAGSTVTGNNVTVDAKNTQDIDAISAAGGVGASAGIGGSLQVSLIGLGSSSTGTDADDELAGVLGPNGALSKANSYSTGSRVGSQSTSGGGSVDMANQSKTGLTNADIATINGKSTYSITGAMNTPLANSTRARVTNSTINATASTTVNAASASALRNTVGAAGIGGAIGAAAAISVAKVSNSVTASVDSLSLLQGRSGSKPSITVSAAAGDKSGNWGGVYTEGRDTIMNRAGAAAGAIGGAASAAIAVGIVDNTVTANLDPTGLGGGAVSVTAADNSNATDNAYGAQAGSAAFGAAVAVTQRSGGVSADFTPTGSSAVTTVTVGSSAGGSLAASVKAAQGGLGFAASGNVATVSDSQDVSATIGSGAKFSQTGGMNVTATHTPKLDADVAGVGISAGLQAGVSYAEATFSGDTTATVDGDGNFGSGAITVQANNAAPGSGYNLDAYALAAGGGILLGANGAIATVTDTSNVSAAWLADALAAGGMTISALRNTSQHAEGTAYSGGIVGVGAVVSTSQSSGNTSATIDGLISAATTRTADLTVSADAKVTSRAEATAGTGGIIAGNAAVARNILTGSTTASATATSANAYLRGGNVTISALRTNDFNGRVDTVNASVVGASGASVQNTVNTATTAEVGANTALKVDNFAMTATGKGVKDWWDGSENGTANIQSASGGVIDAPAAVSTTDYRQTTTARLNTGAKVEVDAALGDSTSVVRLDAASDITLRDRVVMNSGAAIPVATGVSKQQVLQDDNAVMFGSSSQVVAPVGTIIAGSRSNVNMDARVSVDTYGLAGAPDGTAWANYTGSNTLTVDTSALLHADYGNIYLAAGVSSGGVMNQFIINSDVHTWNKTAIPIAGGPDAVSGLTTNSLVLVKPLATVESGADLDIISLTGTDDVNLVFGVNPNSKVTSVGIGKDVYREAAAAAVSAVSNAFGGGDVSFDIKKNTINRSTNGTVDIGGTVRVGLSRSESLTINEVDTNMGSYNQYDENGNFTGTATRWDVGYSVTRTGGIGALTEDTIAVGQNTWNRILWLRQKEVDYAGTTEAAAYASERRFLESRLIDQGLAVRLADGSIDYGRGSTGGQSPKQIAQATLADMQSHVTDVSATLAVKTAAKATAETTYNNIGSLITTATQIAQAQGNVSGDSSNLTVLNTSLTTANGALTTATTNKTNATTAYNNAVTAEATAKTNYDNCIAAGTSCTTGGSLLTTYNNAKATTASALTTKNSADSAYTTAQTNQSAAQTAVTNKQNSINSLITTFNTTQNALITQEGAGYQNIDIITQITVTNYASNVTQSNITTFGTNQTTYNTNVYAPKRADYDTWNSNNSQLAADISNLQNKINTGYYSDVAISGTTQTQLTIPSIAIKLGDVRIQANQLKSTGDKASISAPGDAQVTIVNKAPVALKVGDISISSTGGNVRFNGFLVDNNADINKINDVDTTASGASFDKVNTRRSGANTAQITIESQYNPDNITDPALRRVAPDITLVGSIYNPEGLVQVHSAAGSILSQGSIRAGTVDIQATNGDFVQGYQNGFFNVGADPQYHYQNPSATPSMGIVANGAILLNARYLNINGLVQSGIADWNVTLGGTMQATGDAAFFGVDNNAVISFRAAYLNNRGSGTVPTSGTGSRYTTFTGTGGLSVTYDAETDELYADYTQTAARISTSNGLYRIKASGSDNIGYSYDRINDRFVVDGAAVRGGYIKLFGQIMNTEPTSSGVLGANGQAVNNGLSQANLKVMDGYGNINITNTTGKQVVIGNIDAGSGAAGVIEIADIRSVDSSNNPTILNTVYTRDADGHVLTKQWYGADDTNAPGSYSVGAVGRTASYTPQAGMRYQYTTGTDQSTITEYQAVTRAFFDSDSLGVEHWTEGEVIRGPFIQNKYDIPGGQRLITGSSVGSYYDQTTSTLSNGPATMQILNRWSECDPWFCITSRKYTQWRVTVPTKTITYNTLKADYAIPITFIGSDAGSISIASNSNLLLQGSVRNLNGTTTLNATNGSIKSIADTASITSKNVVLQASGSVGAAADGGPIRIYTAADVNHPARGVPDVTISGYANGGDFAVRQFTANTYLGNITATGKIAITAKGNILESTSANYLQAQRVELTSSEGSVGSITGNSPINLRVKSTDDPNLMTSYGVKISSYGDVNVYSQTWSGNTSGDLLVESIASSTGNARIKSDGKILDGNPNETVDNRTWNQLLAYWDSVQLRGAASVEKQDTMVASYVANVNRDYQNYWEIRARQQEQTGNADYDPNYVYTLSTDERNAFLAAGMNSTQLAEYTQSKTTEYHTLNARLTTLGSSAGSLTTAYDAGYSYKVVSGTQSSGAGALRITSTAGDGTKAYDSTEVTAMLKGSSWTDKELGISLTPGLIKEVTNTNVVVKDPNIRAGKIELYTNAGVGNRVTPGLAIDLTADPSTLTNAQKVALASAERSDISISAQGVATVLQNKPLNVLGSNLVSEALNGGTSTGNIFLASRGGIAVDSVKTSGELRLKVLGNLINSSTLAAGTAAINANVAILESGTGAIGSSGSPLRVASNGSNPSYVARAEDGIWMTAPTGNLYIDTVYSVGDVVLSAPGGAMMAAFADTGMDIRGKSVTLTAQGNIGSSTNFFDVGVDSDQLITATSLAGGIYLRGADGAAFNLGNVSGVTDVYIDGYINPVVIKNNINTTGNISITGGSDIVFKSGTSVTSGVGSIVVEAGDDVVVESTANIKAGKNLSLGGDVIDVNGTLTTSTGAVRLNADEGTLGFGTGALVTGLGSLDAFGSSINMAQTAKIQQTGAVRMTAYGSPAQGAGNAALSSVTGGSVDVNANGTITGVGANNVNVRATAGAVRLGANNISSSGIPVNGTGIGTASQALRVSATTSSYASTASGDVNMLLDNKATFSTIATKSGSVTIAGALGYSVQQIEGTGDIRLDATGGDVTVTNAKTSTGNLAATVSGLATITQASAKNISITGGQRITLGIGNATEDILLAATSTIVGSQLNGRNVTVQGGGPVTVAIAKATGGAINVAGGTTAAVVVANATSDASINVSGGSITSTGSLVSGGGQGVVLDAKAGALNYKTVSSAGTVQMSGRDGVTQAKAGGVTAAGDITATSSAGSVAGGNASNGGGFTSTGGAVNVIAKLDAGANVISAKSVSLQSDRDTRVEDVNTPGSLTVNALGAAYITKVTHAATAMIGAGGNATVNNATVDHLLAVQGYNGLVTVGGTSTVGSATVRGATSATVGTLTATEGGITVAATGSVAGVSAGTLTASAGGIGITAGGGVAVTKLRSRDTTTIGGTSLNLGDIATIDATPGSTSDLLLTASAGSMVYDKLQAQRHLTATVRDTVVPNSGVTVNSVANSYMNAVGGDLTVTGTTVYGGDLLAQNGNVSVQAKGDISVNRAIGRDSVVLKSTQGNITAFKVQTTAAYSSLAPLIGQVTLDAFLAVTVQQLQASGHFQLKSGGNATFGSSLACPSYGSLPHVSVGAGIDGSVGGTFKLVNPSCSSVSGAVNVSAVSKVGF